MNILDKLVFNPVTLTIAKTLLHSLWEGAAVALLLAAALVALRPSRARYAAGCVAIVAMPVAMIVTFAWLMPETPIQISPIGMTRALPQGFVGGFPTAPPGDGPIANYLAWLVPLWIAGVLIFHLRGLLSWVSARRLRTTGVCSAPELWRRRLDRLRGRLDMQRPVALLESCLAEVPVVMGFLKPVILLPVGLLAGMPVLQVEAILLHELAHIRRCDYLVNLFQVFVEGLLFYHPAVWWISRVMREERENCCDDLVVSMTNGAYEYAAALTALERRRGEAGSALAATGGSLVNRIQRLLGRSEKRYAIPMPVATTAILTVIAMAAMAALQLGPNGQTPDRLTHRADIGVASSPARPFGREMLRAKQSNGPTLLAQAHQDPRPVPTPANPQNNEQSDQPAPPAPAPDRQPNEPVQTKDPAKSSVRDTVAAALAAKQQKKKEEAREGKLKTPYRAWLAQEVVYIISDRERKAFQQLKTDAERDKFINQFWLSRDPTPGTDVNEYKEEHYRRIAYANTHFGDMNVDGWRTDRGRIYIEYGPPDAIAAHSHGISPRPPEQSTDTIQTSPFEIWRYRYIKGVGQNIILEFVDKTGNGEYRLTTDPAEKNNLPHGQPAAAGR